MKLGLVALTALAIAGCGTDTGVIVEVTRDDSVTTTIESLSFHVGIDKVDGYPQLFIDLDPEAEVDIDGRDLASDPYRLMLRPGSHADRNLMVVVLARDIQGGVVAFGALDDRVPFMDGSVTVWPIVLSSDMPEGFTVTEAGCIKYLDEDGEPVVLGRAPDSDCDGFVDGDDCDDFNPGTSPGAPEDCTNEQDDDCDDAVDENVDDDGDLIFTCEGDCNDSDDTIFPNAAERCDGVDNNCDGQCDEEQDGDGDDFTVCGSIVLDDGQCFAFDDSKIDCDDTDELTFPGAEERCDGGDNDCNDVCDDRSDLDRDSDGYTECGSVVGVCGTQPGLVDCEPENHGVNPGAQELCNGVDDNCDGIGAESVPCLLTGADGCYQGTQTCTDFVAGVEPDPIALGICVAEESAATQASSDHCSHFDSCTGANDPDPFTCAVDDADSQDVFCTVGFDIVNNLAQCPGRKVVLPTVGDACSWTVLDGVTHGDYSIGVRAAGTADTPAANIDVCGAELVVNANRPLPRATTVILRRDHAAGPDWFGLFIESTPTDVCEGTPGIDCSGL